MELKRRPFVPFFSPGGIEKFMAGKRFYAQRYGEQWEIVHWENGELVCDTATFTAGEQPLETLNIVFQ